MTPPDQPQGTGQGELWRCPVHGLLEPHRHDPEWPDRYDVKGAGVAHPCPIIFDLGMEESCWEQLEPATPVEDTEGGRAAPEGKLPEGGEALNRLAERVAVGRRITIDRGYRNWRVIVGTHEIGERPSYLKGEAPTLAEAVQQALSPDTDKED